jgi:hypothetical protein
LPRLGAGKTTITVAADADPTIATRSIACRITPDARFTKNETTGTMGVTFENLEVQDGSCWWRGGVGSMTVPVEVPGDLVALRFSAQVRARGEQDRVRMRPSTDGGASWREVGRVDGPTPGTTRSVRAAEWPAGTRRALLRFELAGNNTIGILSFRVDADYRDPLATTSRPFDVVHRWTEGGRPRRHVRHITALPMTYTVEAGAEPEMVSVSATMPAGLPSEP